MQPALGFAREPRETLRTVGEQIREYFDSDIAIQLGVASTIDLGYPAFADGADDLYLTQDEDPDRGTLEAQ